MSENLRSLGWPEKELVPLAKNFEGALNQGAYVMQALRSRTSDVHGVKPILKPWVFNSMKWAQILVSSLLDRPD